MSLPLWGELQKSQDNPETIEEAIIRLIGVHNDDPTSHLGEGRSLEAHKTEGVIDHPAGSLLADKRSEKEIWRYYLCRPSEGWQTNGEETYDLDSGLYLRAYENNPNDTWAFLNSIVMGQTGDLEKYSRIFQSPVRILDAESGTEFRLGMYAGTGNPPLGLYFDYASGVLTARAKSSTSDFQSSAITVDISELNTYRIFLEAELEAVLFFINGVQVASLDIPVGMGNEIFQLRFEITPDDGSDDSTMRVEECFSSISTIPIT